MDTNDIEKQYNYACVRVSRTSDMQWAKDVITNMFYSNKLTKIEYTVLFDSLSRERKDD